jgi:hypothetical protein
MSRQMLISIGVLFLVFGSGIGVGLYLDGGTSTSKLSDKNTKNDASGFSSPEAQERVEQNTILSRRILDLEKELADQKSKQGAASSEMIAFFKKYKQQLPLLGYDQNLKITPEMVELLGLSKQEQQAVEQHLQETKNEMDKLDDDITVLAKQTPNSATFNIPSDPRGKTIKDQLAGAISGDIGAERADFFADTKGGFPSAAFSGFAEVKEEIEISWTQQNGSPYYTTTTRYFDSDGTSRGSRSMTGTAIEPQYQKYIAK